MDDIFRKIAHASAELIGSPKVFILAVLAVVLWGVTGPLYNYSDTWQLVINTGTTVITFLMLFLVQNTQNRDAKAIHLKLDELILSMRKARNTFIDIEDQSDQELSNLHDEFRNINPRTETSDKKLAK